MTGVRRLLVANRGEIAVRVIRAARDLGIETVAVHSTADREAPHVRMADVAVEIGPPQATKSYLLTDVILAAAKVVRQHAGLMLDALAVDHERATGPWHLEWVALPESFLAAGAALRHARLMLDGLIVDPERMRRNLDATGGLIVAEAVMMALAEHTGRQEAHHIVARASRATLEKGTPLLDQLERDPAVTRHLDRARLEALTDPINYLGSAPAMVDRLLSGP